MLSKRHLVVTLLLWSCLTVTANATELYVHYRAEKWQSQTYATNQSAQDLITKLTKFGVEIEQETKGQQVTVRYRCVNWKILNVDEEDSANYWKTWFKSLGFEAKIVE
jgi:hypothetical protein